MILVYNDDFYSFFFIYCLLDFLFYLIIVFTLRILVVIIRKVSLEFVFSSFFYWCLKLFSGAGFGLCWEGLGVIEILFFGFRFGLRWSWEVR